MDSRELAHRLRRRSEGAGTGRRGGARGGPRAVLEVPVFVFSLDRWVWGGGGLGAVWLATLEP